MKKGFVRLASAAVLLAGLLAAAPAVLADGGPVNLNTASAEELTALPGIGTAKAKAIVEYRKAHPFQSVDEVMNVRGIGQHLLDSLKGKVTVGAATTAAAPKN